VRVGPGTFVERLDISTAGLTLAGSGERTVIRDKFKPIRVTASDVTVQNLKVDQVNKIDTGGKGIEFNSSANNGAVLNCTVVNGADRAINFEGASNCIVANCTVDNYGGIGIFFVGGSNIAVNNTVKNTDNQGIGVFNDTDDCIIAYNVLENNPTGVELNGDDCIAIGNRIVSPNQFGVNINQTDNIVANNRITNAGTRGISDSGTGTVLDGNLIT
jgi:parallel beta-helix repeat protein